MRLQLVAALAFALISRPTKFPWTGLRFRDLPVKQTMWAAPLAKPDRLALARAIADRLRPDMSTLNIESEARLVEVAQHARIETVDLNGDRVPEIIAQGSGDSGCNPTGNCLFWVFQKSRGV